MFRLTIVEDNGLGDEVAGVLLHVVDTRHLDRPLVLSVVIVIIVAPHSAKHRHHILILGLLQRAIYSYPIATTETVGRDLGHLQSTSAHGRQ